MATDSPRPIAQHQPASRLSARLRPAARPAWASCMLERCEYVRPTDAKGSPPASALAHGSRSPAPARRQSYCAAHPDGPPRGSSHMTVANADDRRQQSARPEMRRSLRPCRMRRQGRRLARCTAHAGLRGEPYSSLDAQRTWARSSAPGRAPIARRICSSLPAGRRQRRRERRAALSAFSLRPRHRCRNRRRAANPEAATSLRADHHTAEGMLAAARSHRATDQSLATAQARSVKVSGQPAASGTRLLRSPVQENRYRLR